MAPTRTKTPNAAIRPLLMFVCASLLIEGYKTIHAKNETSPINTVIVCGLMLMSSGSIGGACSLPKPLLKRDTIVCLYFMGPFVYCDFDFGKSKAVNFLSKKGTLCFYRHF